MGESKGCRECSVPNLVTTEEGGIYVGSIGTGIASQLTLIGSPIIMG